MSVFVLKSDPGSLFSYIPCSVAALFKYLLIGVTIQSVSSI